MEKVASSRQEAVKLGYLEDKIVYLKPSPRKGKMIKDPTHVGYFMHEGATVNFVLPKNARGELVNVFESKAEQEYFENELGIDLSPYKKKDNFWHTFTVKFQKSPVTLYEGVKFDLKNPTDNLRVRVLKKCPEVAPSWEERTKRPSYKFALVEEHYEENKAAKEATKQQLAWKHFGSISNSRTNLRHFLGVYLVNKREIKSVPSDASKEWLMAEVTKIIQEDLDGYMSIMEDKHFKTKAFILDAIKVGAIEKTGVNKFVLAGSTTSWTLNEFVEYIESLEENSDDLYLKIVAQINMKKNDG